MTKMACWFEDDRKQGNIKCVPAHLVDDTLNGSALEESAIAGCLRTTWASVPRDDRDARQ